MRRLLVLDRPAALAYLASVAVGLVVLAAAGQMTSGHNLYRDFVRFHAYLSPQTLYYPTASQVVALARETGRPDQTLVIIGGSSIAYGAGQGTGDLWTRALERRLGDRYAVLNLAMLGGTLQEHGGVAAEALIAGGRDVVFVGQGAGAADGRVYRAIVWDARARGYLLPDPEREAALDLPASPQLDEERSELRIRSALDRWLAFADLWTAIGYRVGFTVWWPGIPPGYLFAEPRAAFSDPTVSLPPDAHHPPHLEQTHRTAIDTLLAGVCTQGEDRAWKPKPETNLGIALLLPPALRERSLLLVMVPSPHYRSHPSESAQACLVATFAQSTDRLRAEGYRTLLLGEDWTEADYVDLLHTSPANAERMAAEIAEAIRAR